MNEELLKLAVNFGGGTAIIVALIFLFKIIIPLTSRGKANNSANYLREKADKMEVRMNAVENRLTRIETKLNNKQYE